MSEGLLYEPRSFWSTQTVTPSINGVTRVQLPKRHFYNGEKWPIQIKRVAVMALNYPLMTAAAALPSQASTLINSVRVAISVPQRYHLNSRRFALMAALAPRPTWAPFAPAAAGPFQPSSLWGQSMLKLDKPIYLPRMGTIEWSLSASTSRGGGTVMPDATMLYQEEGGLFAGSARTFTSQLATLNNGVFVPQNSEERWPYPKTDGVAGGAPDLIDRNWWPPANHFNAQIFNRQESTRAGSTKITDLRCFIDQRVWDDGAFALLGVAGAPQSPYSMRIGTRIRTVNGGTKAWWWRPGAPMALTFDHITPANVYQLPKLITLGPGEQLDIELEFPQVAITENDMQVAISLNGYAGIEG